MEAVRSRLNPLLVHSIWFLSGLTIGACLALLVIKGWTPEWIEATGTWFGAVATVLTLLWAVKSFRSDQAEREVARKAERESDLAEQSARERDQINEASHVLISLRGGAGHGEEPNMMLTSVSIEIRNNSKHLVVVDGVTLDKALKPRTPLPASFLIPAGEAITPHVEIEDVPCKRGDLSGQPLTRFEVQMSYRQDGRDWRRRLEGPPERNDR